MVRPEINQYISASLYYQMLHKNILNLETIYTTVHHKYTMYNM